jgi:hypothetical protein
VSIRMGIWDRVYYSVFNSTLCRVYNRTDGRTCDRVKARALARVWIRVGIGFNACRRTLEEINR